jgi:hypothetical protein
MASMLNPFGKKDKDATPEPVKAPETKKEEKKDAEADD